MPPLALGGDDLSMMTLAEPRVYHTGSNVISLQRAPTRALMVGSILLA
jgi:hypothetical protein